MVMLQTRKRRCRDSRRTAGLTRRVVVSQSSDVELEQHDVAVLHDVVLALVARLARLLGAGLAGERHEIVEADRLGADEAALEIGVDRARRLGSLGAVRYGPGARLLRADGEGGDQADEL